MVVDPAVAVSIVIPATGFGVWAIRLNERVRVLEQSHHETVAFQRLILRGLVRMGVLRQDDVDETEEAVSLKAKE